MRNVKLGRRSLLSLMGAAATGAAVGACGRSEPGQATAEAPLRRPMPRTPAATGPVLSVDAERSHYRDGDVQLMFAFPTGLERTENLPIVLYLHGRDGMSPTPIPYETLSKLETEYANGALPPFGLLAVDGGFNSYWNDGSANGDLMSMLLEEVPAWLRARRLGDRDGLPFAVAGISTGGFGALNYAAERTEVGLPVEAAALLAPALPVTWEHMQEKGVFATEQDWIETDPLHHTEQLGDVPVGVWIGDADVYLEGAERLAQEYPNTPVLSVLPGNHDATVFDVVGADMLRFLGTGVPAEG
ncbi:alpha/beta hydrolase-fold protein [Saccharopolyspora gloriosae]|uniref:Acyl-CoA:diacylglycerol acyltransferase n=1 Tax=Saccharopolyspora gloriosae TaxID=455344 RepID=A0A840NG51_9PSEU|nr:alpha/beta hydrolase-fold protein [Saccharopolyspora gloriosae]MBB5069228.1 S-formylglutathione hydrolase FrmB [Saccharopolyspora gloriosae]